MAGFEGSARSRNKLLIQLHGILGRARKVYGLPSNAAADVEQVPQRQSGDIRVLVGTVTVLCVALRAAAATIAVPVPGWLAD